MKTNLVLLVLVLIAIIASSFAVYAGNKKFIGIIGIAALALALVLWRILSLTRQTAATPESETLRFDFDIDSIQKTAHPTSDAAAITAWKPRQTLITTVLAI